MHKYGAYIIFNEYNLYSYIKIHSIEGRHAYFDIEMKHLRFHGLNFLLNDTDFVFLLK